MKILSIETSCDETSVAILDASIGTKLRFTALAHTVASQIAIHAQYGGVFPAMAKREHTKNLPTVFLATLKETGMNQQEKKPITIDSKKEKQLKEILVKEPEFVEFLLTELSKYKKPKLDAIAVTYGPGLEPALWVGLSFAKALAIFWDLPLIPVNHMEGHILSVLLQEQKEVKKLKVKSKKYTTPKIQFPAIALLVSGGHTELVHVKDFLKYKIIGQTRDDAVGEAFDKVARMLGLPYPGGPEISKLAALNRNSLTPNPSNLLSVFSLPRPMIASRDYDFSFSGLKTAVLYLIRDLTKEHSDILENVGMKQAIAREFEDAAIEVLVSKTNRAVKTAKAKSLIVGGGVAANTYLRKEINEKIATDIYFPERELATDNALMIAIVGAFKYNKKQYKKTFKTIVAIRADGNLKL